MPETHELVLLKKKLGAAQIRAAIAEYFEAEAAGYNGFTASSEKRTKYIRTVDRLIAADLKGAPIAAVLSIGCGTGKREAGIKKALGKEFEILGVDVSESMCDLAREEGLLTVCSPWLAAELGGRRFDAALYLHSFGLAPSSQERLRELKKIAQHLKPGAKLYVDVLNIEDRNEWGPRVAELFSTKNLESGGYELGDVFYRRIGGKAVSFFHYFSLAELKRLLSEAGFGKPRTWFIGYGKKYGELVAANEGAILACTEREDR